MKALRVLILIIIAAFSIYIGYIASTYITDLMDIQQTIYEHYFTMTDKIGNTKDSVMKFFGQEVASSDTPLTDKIDHMNKKNRLVSTSIGTLVAVFVRNIIFGLVYSLRKRYNRIREFIVN